MLAKTIQSPVFIQQEAIRNLLFPKNEVFLSRTEMLSRSESLNRIASLGNLNKRKVQLMFEDIEGQKVVESSIFKITESEIFLMQNIVIPIRRLLSISIL